MKIAVIVVTWNASELMREVLDALGRQTLMPARVFIIDNGSQDLDILSKIVASYSFCELLGLRVNVGFAAANNLGFDQSSDFEYVALLNPDAIPDPEWLLQLARATEAYPDCASFASRLIDYANPHLLDGVGDYLTFWGKPGRIGKGEPERGQFGQIVEVFAPCAAAALYSRRKVLECGGFDEDFFCYVEDVDLGFRLRLAGHHCRYIPEAMVYHVGSGTTGGQHGDFAVYHGHRNLVWMYVKDMPEVLFWLFLPLHLAMNFVALVVFTLRGQGRVIWRAKWDAIKGLEKMWRKRQLVQSTRTATAREIWRLMNKRIIPEG